MAKSDKPAQSRSSRLGLTLPISRVQTKLRATAGTKRVGSGASVYLTAIMDYIATEILEGAATEVLQQKKKKISPESVMTAVRNDRELNQVFAGTTVLIGENISKIARAASKKKAKA